MKAIVTSDVPEWKAARKARREKRQKQDTFKSKKYSELSAKEKDELLRLLAVGAGIVEG